MQENSQNNQPSGIIEVLIKKASLKQQVYTNTHQVFQNFRESVHEMVDENQKTISDKDRRIAFEYRDLGEFQIELKFGGDILIFLMHTNIFEFSRDHEVMKTAYVKEDSSKSYSGMITVFNFLADSFKYNRINDVGYLIGRIFINKDFHYFIEGKREVGMLYNNFGTSIINKEITTKIIESAMSYTINFDLLVPPYDNMKEVTVAEMQTTLENMPMRTGKRLGFKFYADSDINKVE